MNLLTHTGHALIIAGAGYPFTALHRFIAPVLPKRFTAKCGCQARATRLDKWLQKKFAALKRRMTTL